jgi:divalent metal cation (Fe/Co/Zn/Cd) transporter
MNEDPRLPIERAIHKGRKSSLVGIGSSPPTAASRCVAGVLGRSWVFVAPGFESSSDVVCSAVVVWV